LGSGALERRAAASVVVVFIVIAELHLDVQGLGCEVLGAGLANVDWQTFCGYPMQLLVMHEHLGRESLEDPLVADGLVRRHSFFRVPLETSL